MKFLTQYLIRYLVLLGLIFNVTYAVERNTDEINNIAKNWIKLNHKEKKYRIGKKPNFKNSGISKRTIASNKVPLNYQIIELEPKGWIIISKDDVAHPVLGYSYESDVDTLIKNDSFQSWMKGINLEIQLLKEKGIDNDTDLELSVGLSNDLQEDDLLFTSKASIQEKGPLIEKNWNQRNPYNGMTPTINGQHTLVGCVATAWAQIMNYHKWPIQGSGTYSYKMAGNNSLSGTILSANFNTPYNWENMSNEDKAKISYHLGIANNMSYGLDASSAPTKTTNTLNFFKYKMSGKTHRENTTNQWWKDKIKSNIDSEMPIFYSGFPETDEDGGHSFNLDGYKFELGKPDYYHLNWGWGGSLNGWFTIDASQDGHLKFVQKQEAVFDIEPNRVPYTLPNAPSDLKANYITGTHATLVWEDNSNNEMGFNIYDGTTLVKTVLGSSIYLDELSVGTNYEYTVKAYNTVGESAGISVNFTTNTAAKSIITSPSNGEEVPEDTDITLEWENYGATRHKLYISATVNGKDESKMIFLDDETSYNFKLPIGFTSATIQLASYNGTTYLSKHEITLKPMLKPMPKPTPPSNLTATNITTSTATLTWSDNSDNETEFKIYKGTILVETVGADVTSIPLTGLSANTAYTYTVKAYNSTGESAGTSATFTTAMTKPTPPSNLNATNITKNTARLTWKDNANNETGFKIYRGTTLVKTVGANVKTTSLTGLSANTSYTYTVKAYNATGESAGTSKTFKTKTDTVVSKSIITSPVNNERVDKNTNLTLEWKNHGATKKRLVIYSYANGKWKKIAYKYLYSNETSYNFKLPKNFIRAHATIYSYNGEKDIGYSKVYLYPKIKLPNPVYLKLNNITSNSVSLRWQGGSMYASGFRIYEGETLVKTLELNQRNVVLTGLSADTTYIYTVKAYNNESESEGVSITVKTKADGSISESIITSLTNGSELAGDTNVTLEWQNYGATKIILRINAYVNGKKITIANKNFTPPLDTKYNFKLPLGFTHASMQIVSYTGSKYIGSSLVNIYPKIKQLSDYATRYLNAINITENSATLKWHDNSKDETGFKIYNGTTLVKTVGKDVTSTEITGLSAHTNYTYTVKAYNTVSESKGTSTTFKTIFDPTENASIITSPLYGTKVYADTNITLRWNNYGATRMSLRIVAYIEGEAITVASEDFTTTSDISYNFKLPTRFTSASVILYSNKDSHYLGHSAIMLYPKE